MGAATDEFRSLALGIITRHFGEPAASDIEERPSSGGRYLGLTITVNAESKAQLDAVYTELTSCRQVLVAL
jgi:putative lipoic acid-binding regulatory protein